VGRADDTQEFAYTLGSEELVFIIHPDNPLPGNITGYVAKHLFAAGSLLARQQREHRYLLEITRKQ
jgi:hypothetical protein